MTYITLNDFRSEENYNNCNDGGMFIFSLKSVCGLAHQNGSSVMANT